MNSTTGYDPRGILSTGNVMYFYERIDAGHFYLGSGEDGIWGGPDKAGAIGMILTQNDNNAHGWVLDPTVVRFVYKLEGYEPPDEFGIGSGYQDIAYFSYDESSGYVHLEFDFSQLETGDTGSSALVPLDQFQLTTGEYYANPVNDSDVLEVPDYSLNPISWLTAALAAESREADRDAVWREAPGQDSQADPVLTYQRVGEANRKKWNAWVAQQFRPFPRSRRRIFQL